MNWELFFTIANVSVLPAWLLLIIMPNHVITKKLVHSGLWPSVLSIVYTILLFCSFGGEGGMDSLQSLRTSFQRDEVLLLGWVHYLAFDLFIGAWISRQGSSLGFHRLLIVPILLFTLFAGPVGLLLFLTAKAIKQR